ncbi:uncharacterized protein LOC62_05G006881 [Vanrija pseudolonga]|uniref:Phytanoyl-CoA dioxygenase n=1 Tax=Vanrija pseudolonga TaxID=143232 RepID=A0AAF1BNN4_9TREE|nr:hypothetical protein LOC62_05G006881 [Vanrija pseudolonga]
MSPVPVTETATTVQPTLKLRGDASQTTSAYPELDVKGYTVVRGAIPPERAAEYVDQMYQWLESFGRGFKRDDRSTWHVNTVPKFDKGGLFHRYGVGHEQFAWDIRSEPGVIDVFAKLWGTDELTVSYDSVNISLPLEKELTEQQASRWPHTDQSPTRRFKNCVQGIVNLYPNGPLDGGLMVLEGSMPLFEEYFATHEHLAPAEGWSPADWWLHTEEQLQWFYDRGCKWVKVEAGPGDVILWDSRTIHYGVHAQGTEPRIATYVCYKPARDLSPERLALKQECFDNFWSTTHDPINFRVTNADMKGWKLEDWEYLGPRQPPVLTERAKKLAGLVPY